MWKILTAVFLALHGLGHTMILFPAAAKCKETSWLLSRPLGEKTARWLVTGIWLLACLGFIAAALGVYGILVPPSAWRALAVISSFISIAGVSLSLRSYPVVQAIIADILIIGALLILRWPTPEMIGS